MITETKVTKANVKNESYYNLCRLQELTHYANPIGAIETLNLVVRVKKDEGGNILSVVDMGKATN